jgi:hypothetical protein
VSSWEKKILRIKTSVFIPDNHASKAMEKKSRKMGGIENQQMQYQKRRPMSTP